MIRVVLPAHLRNMAKVGKEVTLAVDGAPTQRSVLDALEAEYPMLHESPDAKLPDEVVSGKEPYYVIGAMAGG